MHCCHCHADVFTHHHVVCYLCRLHIVKCVEPCPCVAALLHCHQRYEEHQELGAVGLNGEKRVSTTASVILANQDSKKVGFSFGWDVVLCLVLKQHDGVAVIHHKVTCPHGRAWTDAVGNRTTTVGTNCRNVVGKQ